MREEFYQKLQLDSEEGEEGLTQNYLSSLKYLEVSSSRLSRPTPHILHCLLWQYLLEQASPAVRLATHSYLGRWLGLQLPQGREATLTTALSALRPLQLQPL